MSRPQASTQAVRLACNRCGCLWTEQMIIGVVISVWTAHVKTLRCPECAAGTRYISFITDEAKLRESHPAAHEHKAKAAGEK